MGRKTSKKLKWKPLHFIDDEKPVPKKVDKSSGRKTLKESQISSEPEQNFNISSASANLEEESVIATNEWNRNCCYYNQPPPLFVPSYPCNSSLSLIPFSYHRLQDLGNYRVPYPNLTHEPFPFYEEDRASAEPKSLEGPVGKTEFVESDVSNYRSVPPFVFRPLFYAPPPNVYPWWLPKKRGSRPRFGGEGISYDRWPSRIKCSSKIQPSSMNDIKPRFETDDVLTTDEMEVTDPLTVEKVEKNKVTKEMDRDSDLFVIVKDMVAELVDKVIIQTESSTETLETDENLSETSTETVQKRSSDESKRVNNEEEIEEPPTESYMSHEDDSSGPTTKVRSNYYHLCSDMVEDASMSLCSLEGDIIVHEVDDASECGSEDVELFGHRYETTAERLYKNNQVSLAIELLSVKQDSYHRDFVRNQEPKSCYTNTQVLEGFYGQLHRENKKKREGIELILDSGIHTSDEEAEDDKNRIVGTSEDEEVLFERNESGNDSFEYRRFGTDRSIRRAARKTPFMYLGNSDSWYQCCCIIM